MSDIMNAYTKAWRACWATPEHKACCEARDALNEARKAYWKAEEKFHAGQILSEPEFEEAWKAYEKTWKAYDKADETFEKTREAYITTPEYKALNSIEAEYLNMTY